MKFLLVQTLFSCLIGATTSSCPADDSFCPKIEMAKLYTIKACTGVDPAIVCTDISQGREGVTATYYDDEQAIVIEFNCTGNIMTQNVTVRITPTDQTKPTLLTVKGYDAIMAAITVDIDRTSIDIALTPNTPSGKIVLVYNGEVDVHLDSQTTVAPITQTYTFKSPLFVNQSGPFASGAVSDQFKLTNYDAICKLLCEYYWTAKAISSSTVYNKVPLQTYNRLASLYNAEQKRQELLKSVSIKKIEAPKPTNISLSSKVMGKIDRDIKSICTPRCNLPQNSIKIEVCNMIAISTLFELIEFNGNDSDSIFVLAQAIVNLKTSVSIEEACSILYHAIEMCGGQSAQVKVYNETLKELKVDATSFQNTAFSNSTALRNVLKSHIPSFTTPQSSVSKAQKAEDKKDEKDNEPSSHEESSPADKSKSEGMSTGKKVIIGAAIVVVVVVATVSAVVFFT